MGFKEAVSAVPAKPIVATALVATVLAAAWHGYSLHSFCASRAVLTSSLKTWAEGAIVARSPVALDQANPAEWDEVRIATNVAPPANATSCPFGWHWSNDERAAIAADSHLTMLGFFKDGKLVEVADFDNRWATFDVSGDPIPRDKAMFVVSSNGNALQLIRPGG
jgi:hypothetical protein